MQPVPNGSPPVSVDADVEFREVEKEGEKEKQRRDVWGDLEDEVGKEGKM